MADTLLASTHGFEIDKRKNPPPKGFKERAWTVQSAAMRVAYMVLAATGAPGGSIKWDVEAACARLAPGVPDADLCRMATSIARERMPPSKSWELKIVVGDAVRAEHAAMHEAV